MPKFLALSGMLLCLVGTWLVAFELVSRFRGYAFEIKTMSYRGQGKPEKTPAFERWETKRAKFMWAGLVLITIGSIEQMISIYIVA